MRKSINYFSFSKKNLQRIFLPEILLLSRSVKVHESFGNFLHFFILRIADNKYKHRFAIRALKSAKRYQNKSEIDVSSSDEALLLILKTHLMNLLAEELLPSPRTTVGSDSIRPKRTSSGGDEAF